MPSSKNSGVLKRPPHVEGVNATSGGLFRSMLGAVAVAGAIVTFVWLPAEYGIDPTGVGQMLGLTEMGQIKNQLQVEAEADAVAKDAQFEGSTATMVKLDEIQAQLAAMSERLDAVALLSTSQGEGNAMNSGSPADRSSGAADVWRDEVEYTLTPGQGIEVKLVMDEGAVAWYEWSANGSVLNHDTHGDGNGQNISYEQGRSVAGTSGQLTAAFTGNHGWFWRNRTDENVLVYRANPRGLQRHGVTLTNFERNSIPVTERKT